MSSSNIDRIYSNLMYYWNKDNAPEKIEAAKKTQKVWRERNSEYIKEYNRQDAEVRSMYELLRHLSGIRKPDDPNRYYKRTYGDNWEAAKSVASLYKNLQDYRGTDRRIK